MISADATGRQLAAGLTNPAVGRVYGQLVPLSDIVLTDGDRLVLLDSRTR